VNIPEAVRVTQQALDKGNYGRADLLGRAMRKALPDYPWSPLLLAATAFGIGEYDVARQWCVETDILLARQPVGAFTALEAELRALRAKLSRAEPLVRDGGYLLIKCWGYGLWADVEHVLSSLLLAEMTGRTPIVHWGTNSFYIDEGTEEAFSTLFEPLAPLSLADLAAQTADIYPPKYTRDNLDAVGLNIWDGPNSRLSGLYLLNRREHIVVSDFFTQVAELLPWLEASHWLCGVSVIDAIRLLYAKYLVPAADIAAEVDDFVAANFSPRPVLGVHVRNIDKALEDPSVATQMEQLMPMVEGYLIRQPDLRIFLMTDSSPVLDRYVAKFGDRLFHTDCMRTHNITPLTWRNHDDRRRLGAEVIKDTHIAAACDYFIGHGGSSVTCMVACLKEWPQNSIELIGDNVKIRRNWLVHDW
jgi:hypothetical protein